MGERTDKTYETDPCKIAADEAEIKIIELFAKHFEPMMDRLLDAKLNTHREMIEKVDNIEDQMGPPAFKFRDRPIFSGPLLWTITSIIVFSPLIKALIDWIISKI